MPDMRVDPAHRMGYASGESEKEPLQVLLEAIAGRNRQYSPQQSERQAQDLGEFLAQQQSDMVSREAELQARLAQLEQESELVRDTLRERERELAEQLDAQRRSYRDTPPPDTLASVADPALETRQAWKNTLRQTYGSGAGHIRPANPRSASPGPNTNQRDAVIHREGVSPPSREKPAWGSPDPRGVWQPPRPAARGPFETGMPPLPERGHPREVSTHAAEELNADRMSLEAREAAMEQAWEARRAQIQAMQQELSDRRQQLEQFQLETEGLYQTSLEMRMVSEQLWSQVLTAVPSATATQRLRGLRQQLESFLTNAERRLEDRRDEVRHAARQLEQQQEKLQENRRIFDAWMRERYRQLDEQTARLAAREREMLSGSAGR